MVQPFSAVFGALLTGVVANCPTTKRLEYCVGTAPWCGADWSDCRHGYHPLRWDNGGNELCGHSCDFGSKLVCYKDVPAKYQIRAVTGAWAPVTSSNSAKEIIVQRKVGITFTETVTETRTFGESVSQSAEAGFEAQGVSGKVSLTKEQSMEFSRTQSYSWTREEEELSRQTFDPAQGQQVWQWQWTINALSCKPALAKTKMYESTRNRIEPPCCVPGCFKSYLNMKECVCGPNLCTKARNILRGGDGTNFDNGRLNQGDCLESVYARGGKYKACMQTDGNFVKYFCHSNGYCEPQWEAKSWRGEGKGPFFLQMQSNCDLVVYTGSYQPAWHSATGDKCTGSFLIMQGDGNLVVYSGSENPKWNSGSGGMNPDLMNTSHVVI